jgi:hemolysin-activating ACP:hemolysin acyltransferase
MIERRTAKLNATLEIDAEKHRMRAGIQSSAAYSASTDNSLSSLIQICHSSQQYRVYEAKGNEPRGFLSWAWLSAFTLERLTANPLAPLHPSEWNEGTSLCFRDIAATPEIAAAIASDLGGGLFPMEPCYVTMQTDASGGLSLIRFESNERYELAEWLRDLYPRAD